MEILSPHDRRSKVGHARSTAHPFVDLRRNTEPETTSSRARGSDVSTSRVNITNAILTMRGDDAPEYPVVTRIWNAGQLSRVGPIAGIIAGGAWRGAFGRDNRSVSHRSGDPLLGQDRGRKSRCAEFCDDSRRAHRADV